MSTTAIWIINGIVILTFLYICFGMALGGWIAAMRRGDAVTIIPKKEGKQRPIWLQILLIIAALLVSIILVGLLWIPLPTILPESRQTIQIILGFVLYLAGSIFILWGRRSLGRMWGISTSREVKLKQDHKLIQEGPYRFIRHPMYFGWWVVMVGLILMYHTWILLIFFIFSIISFLGRARREEQVLYEQFGEEWAEYRKRTKFMIPYIW